MNNLYYVLTFIAALPIYWILYRLGLVYSKKIKISQVINTNVGSKRGPEVWFPLGFALLTVGLVYAAPLLLAAPTILFLAFLTPAMATDMEDYILPDKFTYPAVVLAFILSLLIPQLHGENLILWGGIQSILGILTGFSLMYGLAVFAYYIYGKDAVGGGDLKLMSAIGGLLGWMSPIYILCAGAMIGSILAIITRKGRKNHIPFGPSIMIAYGTWFLGGKQFMESMITTLHNIVIFIIR